MPTIINPYKGGTGMGDDLFGIGGLADTFFGPKASQSAYTREKFKEAQRQNEYTPLLADSVRGLGVPSANLNEAAARAIMAGVPIDQIAGANLLTATNRNSNDLGGNFVTGAALGAKVPYASTVAGNNAALASHAATEAARTDRLVLADEQKTARTPITVFDRTKPNGIDTITMADFQAAPRGTYTIVPGQDIFKSAMASQLLFQPGTAPPAPAWPMPGAPVDNSILTTPVDPNAGFSLPTTPPAATAPPVVMTDEQRKYLGADPNNKGRNYVVTNAAGDEVDSGVTLDEGLTDNRKRPIVLKDGEKIRLIDATNPAAGTFGGPSSAAKEVRDLRVATAVTVKQIDNLDNLLSQPGAERSTGWVGQGQVFANNLRSQIDAITGTAKEMGYGAYATQFEQGAKQVVAANPRLEAMIQSGAVSRAVLESQISSLGYAIARLNASGGGTLGVKDVEDGLKQIGATMHDPVAFKAVLANLKKNIIERQQITEQAIGTTVSPATSRALNLGGQAAPAPPPPAATGGAVPGGTTSTGRTWSLEPP